jgi:hypothetical protein
MLCANTCIFRNQRAIFRESNNNYFNTYAAWVLQSFSFAFLYGVILSVLDPRKCEYLKDYSLDF